MRQNNISAPSTDEMSVQPLDILLVDDTDIDVKIILRAFKDGKIKHRIQRAANGQEALDYIYNRGDFKDKQKFPRPDFILLDIQMPVLDGHGEFNH